MSDQMPKKLPIEEGGSLDEIRFFVCRVYSRYGGTIGTGFSAELAERDAIEKLEPAPEMEMDPESEFKFNFDNRDEVEEFVYGFGEAIKKREVARKKLRDGTGGEMFLLPRGTTHFAMTRYGSIIWRNVNSTTVEQVVELKFSDGKWVEK